MLIYWRTDGGGTGCSVGAAAGTTDCCPTSSNADAALDRPTSSGVCGAADGLVLGDVGGCHKTTFPTSEASNDAARSGEP
ncbi:UNVERIFIED_CONTAM: hypothetical protein Sradi_2626900 [Sesamum radiatum]|uniref:Uncharacterized protein n=1 Tax=Sesamum radiatum TaxID=300843 RepID=A0AAW2S6S9_SESRA